MLLIVMALLGWLLGFGLLCRRYVVIVLVAGLLGCCVLIALLYCLLNSVFMVLWCGLCMRLFVGCVADA